MNHHAALTHILSLVSDPNHPTRNDYETWRLEVKKTCEAALAGALTDASNLPELDGEWDYKGDDPIWQILYRWAKQRDRDVNRLFLRSDTVLHGLHHTLTVALADARQAAAREMRVPKSAVILGPNTASIWTDDKGFASEFTPPGNAFAEPTQAARVAIWFESWDEAVAFSNLVRALPDNA